MQKLLLALIFNLSFAVSALAATINVDFTLDGTVSDGTYNYQDDLIIRSSNPTNSVIQSDVGLGVSDNYLNSPNEGLSLEFSQPVSNLKLTFADWGDEDNLFVSSGLVAYNLICFSTCKPKYPQVDDNGELQFYFDVTTLYLNIFGTDDETSTSLFSASWEDGSLSTIPLPAALPLYAAGMGLLGLLGWRKRRKSA